MMLKLVTYPSSDPIAFPPHHPNVQFSTVMFDEPHTQ
jgi:hypothetical protein